MRTRCHRDAPRGRPRAAAGAVDPRRAHWQGGTQKLVGAIANEKKNAKKAAKRSGADVEAAAAAVLRRQVRLLLPSANDVKAAWRHLARISRKLRSPPSRRRRQLPRPHPRRRHQRRRACIHSVGCPAAQPCSEASEAKIAGAHMLSTAITSGSHVFLVCFYDICGGLHAKKRVSEHLTPPPPMFCLCVSSVHRCGTQAPPPAPHPFARWAGLCGAHCDWSESERTRPAG